MEPRLIVRQKITAFANKYEIYSIENDNERLIAFAQQKRLAFKEEVIFYTNENKTEVVFSFRAEKVLDVHGRYIVEDDRAQMIGAFRKEFTKSLINSTWSVLDNSNQPKLQISESNQALALLRRFAGFIPILGELADIVMLLLRYHFVLVDLDTNETVGFYKKTRLFRDHYELSMAETAFSEHDWRVLASLAVALDALQSR